MTYYHRQMSVRLLCATAIVALTTIGCQSAERRSGGRQIARAPQDAAGPVHAEPSASDLYIPPAVEEIPPVPMPSQGSQRDSINAPPPPVPPIGGDVTWSLDRSRGQLKPVSNTIDDTPGLISPGRARSLRDFIIGRDARTVR